MSSETKEKSEIIRRAQSVAETAVGAIQAAKVPEELDELRVKFLGRKSEIIELSRSLKAVPKEDRREVGQAVNQAKQQIEQTLQAHKEQLESAGAAPAPKGAVDVTLPGLRTRPGTRHPVMQVMEEVKSIMLGLGFRYDDYPEVETEFFNFDGLNTPSWHPARDMHDSFYTESGRVMRTHTTAFQVRAMKSTGTPPIRAMTSGRCFRRDAIDASHFPIFHQLDAIAIDRSISFANLKWTLYQLAQSLFGEDVKLRFRPSYFPFTTPSAEVDVFFRGKWLEILGSGMMRPEVLRAGDLDPDEWQGFAFGLGIDRMAMIKHNIDDIRLMYDNEEAFLRQF